MLADPNFLNMLKDWSEQKLVLDAAKSREMELRQAIFTFAFPAPVEGTNRVGLPGDWKLKGTHKIDRKIDEAALPAIVEQVKTLDGSEASGGAMPFNTDLLVRHKPELSVTAYKALTDAQRAVFDHALIVKAGSPSLELEAPKPPKE